MAKKQSKKLIRTKISDRLTKTFIDLEATLGKKKFERTIRKASKVLSAKIKNLEHRDETATADVPQIHKIAK